MLIIICCDKKKPEENLSVMKIHRIEGSIENKIGCTMLVVDPKTVFEPDPNRRYSQFVTKKTKTTIN